MENEINKDLFMSVVYVMLEYGYPIPDHIYAKYNEMWDALDFKEDLNAAAEYLFNKLR